MWKITILLLLMFGINSTSTYGESVEFPDIQSFEKQVQKTYILMLNEQNVAIAKQEIKKKYPNVSINHEFREVFTGLSVSGTLYDLQRLREEPYIDSSHASVSYHAKNEGSASYIGSEKVRGMFDKKNQRLTGRGIKVGIIDTGIDFNHPDLKLNYRGGYDVVDQDYSPMETVSKQGEPTLHGTHVAGIIGANGKMRGVAPEAEIYAYRALGPGGSGSSENVILAVEKAIQDGVDVINLSLGNDINGPDLPTSLALNKAVEKGIVAVTSSGNSGPGLWTVGSPGTAQQAISVGASVSPTHIPFIKMEKLSQQISLSPLPNAAKWDIDQTIVLTDAGSGREVADVGNKVVLMKTGEISLSKKISKAEKAGAKAVIVYHAINGVVDESVSESFSIPVVMVSSDVGESIKKEIQKGNVYAFASMETVEDIITPFSSRGPVTSTWDIKPDVVAPGYQIMSTVPNGYEPLNGTSMAAPHVAGACALLLQAHPNWSPEQVKAALMSTAKPIRNLKGELYHSYEQGAGRIQVERAVKATTLLSPSTLSFGVFEGQSNKRIKMRIFNEANYKNVYHVTPPTKTFGEIWRVPLSFTLKPKETKTIAVDLQVNSHQKKKGIYDGRLEIRDSRETISIPYLYMVEKPNYPRVMGLQAVQGSDEKTYLYELFLPEGADEFGIAVYDIDTLRFVSYLDVDKKLERGMLKRKIQLQEELPKGEYKVFAYAKKDGKTEVANAGLVIE
ncbi:S8 family serine peptidase [Priestia flexa]|uniref:S8 family serine peptidase n=1 Tax=Priestia flexa TaxID=86664 RepID=A0A8I1MIF5_9BACI|nr:S8 family serine peptidase [Priestia flexa]MBN8252931.1 S8 family serine peptidase [Priestia flexa]